VTNLVENASKYTPDGGTIQLRLSHQAGRVTFEVQDSGYGIAKPRQSRLFSRFYRAKEAGTEHIPGTGLGLSLVKTAIERHGGEVFVTSALGEGSTFGFWLPALQG
jgi:signal transduction histidine kinase